MKTRPNERMIKGNTVESTTRIEFKEKKGRCKKKKDKIKQ